MLSVEPLLEDLGTLDLEGVGWVIAGGESGPRARPMEAAWVRSVRDQCLAAGVPFFFKQWGGFRKGRAPLKLLEKRFGNDVGEQVGSNLMGGSYMAAVEKSELDTLGDPLVCVTVSEERRDDSGQTRSVEVQKLVGMDDAADGFFWLAGQGGYGIMTSPAMGRTVAALLTAGAIPPDLAELGVTKEALAPARCRAR